MSTSSGLISDASRKGILGAPQAWSKLLNEWVQIAHRRRSAIRRACRQGVAVVVLFLGTPVAASDLTLPADVPARSEGFWVMDQAGTLSDGTTTFNIRKIWHICLDAKADRALYELEVRQQQASVASLKETCEQPRLAYQDNVLSWTMHCSGPSPIEDKIGRTDIRHATSFLSDKEAQAESFVINRDNLIQSDGHFVTRMRHAGVCDGNVEPGDLKPGDMMLMHWRVNGEETLKGRQQSNVHTEIDDLKAFTASQLGSHPSQDGRGRATEASGG